MLLSPLRNFAFIIVQIFRGAKTIFYCFCEYPSSIPNEILFQSPYPHRGLCSELMDSFIELSYFNTKFEFDSHKPVLLYYLVKA